MFKEKLTANGITIAYYITHAEKDNTIFFIHGNSTSSNTWRKQIESSLLADYRLVTIDLPNHGNSAPINKTGDFSLQDIAKIMEVAVMQLVNDKPYLICCISLGTNIVAEMLTGTIEPNGLILAGPCIVGAGVGLDKMMLPGADPSAVFAENVQEQAVVNYASAVSLSEYKDDLDFFLKDYNSVQGTFRSSLFATIATANYSDEVAIIQQVKYPVCIVFGEDEKLVNTHYLDDAPINLWNNTIYKIPLASHLLNIDAPEAFNELIAAYAKDTFTTNAA